MAFYAAGLPNVAAATTDLWPSIANTLMVPWRGATSSPASQRPRPQKQTEGRELRPAETEAAATLSKPELPDFLSHRNLPRSFLQPTPAPASPRDIRASMADMTPQALVAANLLLRQPLASSLVPMSPAARARLMRTSLLQFHLRPNSSLEHGARGASLPRFMSTLRQPIASRTLLGVAGLRLGSGVLSSPPHRGFSTGGISANLLASREASANRNPGSATAQNAFYQVLLKANMPHIVVERYNSGRFAANEPATEAYQRALGMISLTTGTGGADLASAQIGGLAANKTLLSPAQLQAVTQAMAARAHGSNVAVAKGAQGTGAKEAPIHVVVDQPMGEQVFRWVKFFLWFCLILYLSLVVVTMMMEGLSQFRRPGGARMDSEVKSENQTSRFSDVHGCDEAKEELQELVEFLKNPDKFSTLGGKLPKGILLVGPPGTGKTLLARAVAGEAGVPFFYMSGSEFDEVYVGVGAKRVRDLFNSAKSKSPAIVFIDELDAIGGRRNARDAAYVKQTLNQLLTELDGFEQNSGVVILAATNFPELLDQALTRPGRFDRHVIVDLPDVRGRLAILNHHAKKVKADPEVDLKAIALQTSGLSGADLESIVNQAAIHASKAKSLSVTMKDFDWARDKVIMGAERRNMVITPKEKQMTAYHEAGHALASFYSESSPNKLYKVTVLPRGRSLGHTSSLPEMDKYSMSAREYMAMIDVCLGGKLAEEIVYGSEMVTSGVSQDLKMATTIAYEMVSQFGMSEKLGPVEYGTRFASLSSHTRAMIEGEVQRTLSESYERTKKLLLSKRKELDLLAKALVDYETLDKNEVSKVITGQKLLDRIPVPVGPMVVPKGPGLEPLPLAGKDDDEAPPPAPPGIVPRTDENR